MGMFDYVRFKMACPSCGKELNDFQSKDGPCELKSIKAHHLNNFYDYCECKAYINFLKPWRKKRWRMTVLYPCQDGGRRRDFDLDKKYSKSQIKEMTP